MTTAEGGAISSKHPEILKKAKRFARQGIVREKNELIDGSQGPWHQEVHNFGLNYRLPDVLCALGISQLEKIENFKQARAEIFDYYQKNLSQIEEIILPPIRNYTSPMWHLFHIHVDKNNRRMLYEYLRKHSILVQVNYMPAHWHPVFKNIKFASSNLERSEEFYRTEISLPIYAGLNEEELEFVVNKIKLYYEKSAV
jgi:dTDP-4-amino-4,6-dideoxygalactose transaminase